LGASYSKTIGKSGKQRRGQLFYRGKEGVGRGVINSKCVEVNCGGFSLAEFGSLSLTGLLPGGGESLSSSCWESKVVLYSSVNLQSPSLPVGSAID